MSTLVPYFYSFILFTNKERDRWQTWASASNLPLKAVKFSAAIDSVCLGVSRDLFHLSLKLFQTPECFRTETPDELHRVCLSSRHQHFKNRPGRPWRWERCQSLHCLTASLLPFALTACSSQFPPGNSVCVLARVRWCVWTLDKTSGAPV